LDKYDDKISDILKEVQQAYTEYIKTKKELDELISYSQDIKKEKEKLQYDISQIQSADLKKDEDSEIEKKIVKLKNHAVIYDNVEKAYELIYKNDKSVYQNLQNSVLYLNKARIADDSLSEYSEKLDGIIASIEDVYISLRDYMADADYENTSIDEVEERAYLITQLKRHYGVGIDEILLLKDEMINKLSRLTNLDIEIENKSKEEKQKKEQYFIKADILSKLRCQIKSQLEENVVKQLNELSMPDAVFVVI
jgi:DNA repair protein RecN (Recombination protein N)